MVEHRVKVLRGRLSGWRDRGVSTQGFAASRDGRECEGRDEALDARG